MVNTFNCESGYRHYHKGKVLVSPKNKNGSYDYGWPQINSIHEVEAEKQGFHLWDMTPEQAWIMAKLVYKKEGATAWTCYRS